MLNRESRQQIDYKIISKMKKNTELCEDVVKSLKKLERSIRPSFEDVFPVVCDIKKAIQLVDKIGDRFVFAAGCFAMDDVEEGDHAEP